MHDEGVRCMVMRGGTSKGLYFLAGDLPPAGPDRDALLLAVMGSPDARQIDGMGGAHPLTSKVAVVSPSHDGAADVDYLFLQVMVDRPIVTDSQNCGNILAGVGPFAVERGLVHVFDDGGSLSAIPAKGVPANGEACVRIRMLNTGGIAVATFPMSGGLPVYAGATTIAGVPGSSAEVRIDFEDIEGSSCGALLPTGNAVDIVEGIAVTLIDNGMPVVVISAADVDVTGYEEPYELEANASLRVVIERIRLAAGPLMNLGDVTDQTVPKLTIVAPARHGGTISTRTFIPHRCHDAIGVLGAVSVATACLLPGSPAAALAVGAHAGDAHVGTLVVEHPTGTFDAAIDYSMSDGQIVLHRAGIVRTARKLMDGAVFPRD